MRFSISISILFLLASAALPQEPESALEPAALEAFVDGYMASYLKEAHVAGATVAFIEGDRIVFAKGYGYADVFSSSPVDPARTLFRIGSVSKLFIWTAVMQLVERGEIDLDADVNDYLKDLEVPSDFGGPVTVGQLMTHTAGLDERVLGLFARDAESLRPLGDILRDELPKRVRPGSDLISYSNHGTALAMYVVEQVSGVPWQEYLERNILEPLSLENTTFTQPLPEALAPGMSKGYRFENKELVERPFEFVPLASVGAAASSATDMARFMAAHLGLGEVTGTRILEEETSRTMQQTLFRFHPEVSGMAHGFMELERNGVRIVGHGGDTELFHTLFAFFPEERIGLFASFNTAGADYGNLLDAFVDWKYPLEEGPASAANQGTSLGRFAGHYRPTRYPHGSLAKLSALLGTFEVRVEEDSLVNTALPVKKRFRQVGPLLFREPDDGTTLAFRESAGGAVTHMFWSDVPVITFERVPLTETPSVVGPLLGGGLFLAFAALLFWPLAAWARWHYGVKLAPERRVPALARWSAWASCLALVAFALGLAVILRDPMEVVYGLPAGTRSLFWLPLVSALLAVLALVGAIRAFRTGRGSFVGKIVFALVAVALLLAFWQLSVWNLAWPGPG